MPALGGVIFNRCAPQLLCFPQPTSYRLSSACPLLSARVLFLSPFTTTPPTTMTLYFPDQMTALTPDSRVSVHEAAPSIWVITLLGHETHDNRLTPTMLQAYLDALTYIEQAWSKAYPSTKQLPPNRRGGALVTTGCTGPSNPSTKFFSNGLNYLLAVRTGAEFGVLYQQVMHRLMSFP